MQIASLWGVPWPASLMFTSLQALSQGSPTSNASAYELALERATQAVERAAHQRLAARAASDWGRGKDQKRSVSSASGPKPGGG